MASTLDQSKKRAVRKSRKTAGKELFWVRKPNRELDRAGDWLLSNLTAMRADATSRADSR